uniref:DNA polymerase n=1 Tax=Cryphonectria parasitica TaxID=5116 RepID=O94125_CRYPA|nr:DNA polymerase [Cryphonectria parasitica]
MINENENENEICLKDDFQTNETVDTTVLNNVPDTVIETVDNTVTFTEEEEEVAVVVDEDADLDPDSLKWLTEFNNSKKVDEGFAENGKDLIEIELWPGINLSVVVCIDSNGETFYKNLTLQFKEDLTMKEIIHTVDDLLKHLASPGRKGFVTPSDFKLESQPVIDKISKYMLEENLKDVTENGDEMDLYIENYKWIWNIINLNIYTLMHVRLSNDNLDSKASDSDSDLLAGFKHLMSRLYNNIDPSIRLKLNKPGISIVQNIYTGFDTEYKYRDKIFNDLISVQLAVNTRTILKIPKKETFYVCELDTLNNKAYPVKKLKGFRYDLFEDIVNKCVNKIRLLKSDKYDTILNILHEGFKGLTISNPDIFKSYERDGYFYIALPRTNVEKHVYLNKDNVGFTFNDLLETSSKMGSRYLDADYSKIRTILKNIRKFYGRDNAMVELFKNKDSEVGILDDLDTDTLSITPTTGLSDVKRYSRSKIRSLDININRIRTNYIIAHLTNADLSMLKDFDNVKDSLDIVNKSFITLGKPLKHGNFNVHIRDTMLLAPAGKKGLAAIGSLLGLGKIELEKTELESMDLLLSNDREKFLRYAITDAIITLLYANYMEDQLFNSRVVGVPISLSSLSAAYVKNEWEKSGYKGYQINPLYLIGDSGVTQTPQGLYKTKEVGRKISMYISNYRGGRNESFMYGVDNSRYWIDYDLTSAYTSAMALLGNPDYNNARNLTEEELFKMTDEDLIMSYTIFSTKFKFPSNTKYPSIPCYLNESTTIYPLEGEATLTGVEFVLAKEQNCEFIDIKDIFIIPFESVLEKTGGSRGRKKVTCKFVNQPFRNIIKELQDRRLQHPKKSLGNLMEKEKGNSIYGNVVKGMSNQKKFDIKTGRTVRMEGGLLTNPIIASWITAFIRSVVGECIHNVSLLKGSVVSITTDGFITNLKDLEYNIIRGRIKTKALISSYRKVREFLSPDSNPDALELKTRTVGIISWTTRGQFSLDGQLKATTGFQVKGLNFEDLDNVFRSTMTGEDRVIEFIQSSLRSAKDIYMHGGHVTKTYADRVFRMEYDNKRVLNIPVELLEEDKFNNHLLDSSPAKNVKTVEGLRFLRCIHRKNVYNKMTSKAGSSKYKSDLDLAIRNFVKGCVKDPIGYNLTAFKSYSDLIDFVKNYKKDYRISKTSISNLKNRKMVVKGVPRNPDTLAFAEYVKEKFPSFDETQFFEKVYDK